MRRSRSERVRGMREGMSTTRLFRWGAVAGFVSAVAMILGKVLMLLPSEWPGEVSDFVSPLFGLLAVLTVYLWQREPAGLSGAIAFVFMFIGLALVTSLDFFGAFIRLELSEEIRDQLMEGTPGIAFATSGLIFLLGVILFGISLLHSQQYPKLPSWLFLVGFVLVPLGELLPEWVIVAGSVMAGIGVFWLSGVVWSGAGRAPANGDAASGTFRSP